MIPTKSRLRLCTVLLMVNLVFIWGNSLLPGSISGWLSNWLRDALAALFGGAPGETTGHGLLRKLAHFTEFATLGICLRWLWGMLRQKTMQVYGVSLALGIAVACIDETIQIFVPGRGPSIKDVGIDTLGVILGIALLSLIHGITKKQWRKTKYDKTDCSGVDAGADNRFHRLRQTPQ